MSTAKPNLLFSYNWNNKLDCQSYTTIRLTKKYNVGDELDVMLNGQFIHRAVCRFKIERLLHQVNDFFAYVDTGYDSFRCQEIIKTMYKKYKIDWNTQPVYIYVFDKLKA